MGGFEGADHFNSHGTPLDMAAVNAHVERLDEDYAAAAALGLRTLRESIGWRLAEPTPGRFDLGRLQRMAECADRHGIQVVWTLMHYGTPSDLSLLDDRLIDRFAAFAGAVARRLRPLSAAPPVYNPINEIGFVAWAATQSNLLHPYRGSADGSLHGSPERNTLEAGYEVKHRLVRASLAGMAAMRAEDPRARFLHVEPLVHVVASAERPDLGGLAETVDGYQWQVWDLLAGRGDLAVDPASRLDLIGVNYYHSGQWEADTGRRLSWHERDPRRRPFSALLQAAWERYCRPLIVAETSYVGGGRAAWLHETLAEVATARRSGVPVQGVCLYPLVDRHDWDDPDHWHHSGLWNVEPGAGSSRSLCAPYAAALSLWQQALPHSPSTGLPMTTLIVFSHLRWNFVYQRPQHLMSRLARHYRVLFVEEPVRTDGPPRLDIQPQGPRLDVLVPGTPIDAPGFHDDQLSLLKPLIADYLRTQGIDDYVIWFYTPMALPLMAPLHPRTVIYDCMDELSAFKHAPRQLRQRETALLKTAGLVLTGGPALHESKRGLHDNLHCFASSVDADHFSPQRLLPGSESAAEAARLQSALPHPRLGFFGVIDERLDTALVDRLARERPEWQIVMVGPVVKIDPARLPQHPNLHWLGMQRYELLPYLMAGWDVCLMPFALNDATRFISPTKTLEYMAGDKPVVSTAVHDVVALYGSVVRIADDGDDFIRACEETLQRTPGERQRHSEQMQLTVGNGSWDRTAERVHRLIEDELTKAPRATDALHGLPAQPPTASAPAFALDAATPVVPGVPRQVRHLVIGAGPTGLAAAYHLGQESPGKDCLLIERSASVGGWCRSIEEQGFTFDYAGHIMFSNEPYVLDLYRRLLGDNVHWQNREAWIYSKNVYTRYPFQGSLYGLPPKVLSECLIGAIEARFGALDAKAPATPAGGSQANFADFIQQVWGSGIGRHFATPYNEKLWAVPLTEMETSWLGGRVPMPDLRQMIEGALEPTPPPMGPNARFGYPLRGGFQALMDGFLPLLQGELALNTEVLHVSPAQRTVRLDDGRSLRFDSLISTMPLPLLVEACGDEAPAEVKAAAKALRHVSVRCVNLGIGVKEGDPPLTDKHWIYYPEDSVFHRIFVQGNASPHNNPSGGFGLTCEITYSPAKPLPCEGAALVQRVIDDCRKVGIIGADAPVLLAQQVDMPCAYVVYDHARAANVTLIRQWFEGFGIVLAGRYSEWEYYNSDHAFIAGRKAAAQVMASLEVDRAAPATRTAGAW